MITTKKNYTLYAPRNTWDMNYHILDKNKRVEYLIDICDVTNDENDENECLYIQTLLALDDIYKILSYAWKQNQY